MVECEYDGNTMDEKKIRVLIDTWWNVNADKSPLAMASVTVLIDTWWNVNFYGRVDIISAYRF